MNVQPRRAQPGFSERSCLADNFPTMMHLPEKLTTSLAYVGAATSCFLAIQVARHLYCYLRPSGLPRYNPPGKDAWALVTGSTDGIGFGFAQELCKRGFNVFLHGRNRDKLLRRQAELLADYPNANVRIIVFDAVNNHEDLDTIVQEIGDTPLTVLINNIGGEVTLFTRLADFTFEQANATINLNNTFMVQITRKLLPILERNGPGLVLNISSAAAYGMPTLSVYSGTKGFVDSFTRSLQAEMTIDGKDVEVLGLRVGNTQSKGNDVKVNLFTPTSRALADAALNRVGCGGPIVWAYWLHSLQGLSFHIVPRRKLVRVLGDHLNTMKRDHEAKLAKQQ
ncbi:putative short chain dehydrogenase/reductase [Aspergillus clavatus NRRL 1]|uniref:Short chain dehydrogenase/reductase, putative n=1 Tax=Aspergillus clavatus (strain ATCC 1007 / CBS 513.65 / DSM 816 / NCTC 3887 / NRRL 1 / QM 1276 / 107) TaxID=344612 RepID=A1CNI4_ASPCL|nr:short chain dehydrogenase/reductase, putative [Aspergillus clavatus NRRL 1]EAW07205.1 short chain dehydrogenase/reductase, putative [Aspergillus clavatus NRRL 1]